nr:hypothetical protein [Nitrospiraceae bacterium]
VRIGDRSVIAAGSTVTTDVPDDALLLSRAPQEIRPEGGVRYHHRREKRPEVKNGRSAPKKKDRE